MNKSLLSNKGASKKEKAPKTTNSESFFKERLMAALLIGSILIILSLSIILLAQSCFKIASTSPSPSVANKPETAGVPLASGDYEKRMIDLKTSKLNPDQLKGLIGMHFVENDEEIKAMSLDTAKTISRTQIPEKCRVVPPGHMVTMDFVEDRLNLHIDDKKQIIKAKYG